MRALLKASIDHVKSIGDRDLSVALEAAIRAGSIIASGWEGKLDDLGVQEKGVGDLVSVVDVKAEESVLDVLRGEFPNDLILSEETQQGTVPQPGKRMWIVDPLDGTSSFVYHTCPDLVSVLIALYDCDVGRVTRAVELFPVGPNVGACYALLGGGSYCDGIRLVNPPSVPSLRRCWVNLNHYGDEAKETRLMAAARKGLRSADGGSCGMVTTLPASSGVAVALFRGSSGLGRLDAVVHDNREESVKQATWDVAGPQLIVEEAGGVFWDAKKGERYDLFKATPILIARTKELAQEIRQVIQKFGGLE